MSRSLRTEQGLGSRKPVQTAPRQRAAARRCRSTQERAHNGSSPYREYYGYFSLLREGRGQDYNQSTLRPYGEHYGYFSAKMGGAVS